MSLNITASGPSILSKSFEKYFHKRRVLFEKYNTKLEEKLLLVLIENAGYKQMK